MKIEKIARFNSQEVIAALQALFPASCEGKNHKIFAVDYDGNQKGDAVQDKATAVILVWDAPEIQLEKSPTSKKKKKSFFGG